MKCKYCGAENQPPGKFCRSCGAKLPNYVPFVVIGAIAIIVVVIIIFS